MRSLLAFERPLVEYLFDLAELSVDLDTLQVYPLADGNMGGLLIGTGDSSRLRGSSPSECHFFDEDGVAVSAVLNLDHWGAPFEIDIWRVDFAPLVRWPTREVIRAGTL